MKAYELVSFFQWVYCRVSLDTLSKILDRRKDYYLESKFRLMQSDFLTFFCSLDTENQDRFVEAWRNK